MYRIEFSNSKDKPIFIQVDPWACLYRLEKGQSIELVMECSSSQPTFSVDEYDDENRIVTLVDCDEFYVVIDGKKVHWEDYQSNVG